MDIGRLCRICLIDVKCGVFLFGENAFLPEKIRNYLSISITVRDELSKTICKECFSKIEEFDAFATMALENQEKMSIYINIMTLASSKTDVSLPQACPTNPSEDNADTEILALDPTSILQCCLEESDTEIEPDPPQMEYQFSIEPEGAPSEEGDQEKEAQESVSSDGENGENTRIIYLCSICKTNFSTNGELQEHMHVHTDFDSNQVLDLSFDASVQGNAATAVASEVKVEEYEILLQIPEQETSATPEEVNVEMVESYRCPICVKEFTSTISLQFHLESHRPKGRFGCDLCSRVFKTEANLIKHKEAHEGMRYTCEVCGRVYPTNSTLKAHSITHSTLRPHKCPTCDKTFKRNQDLKFHINQHTGARPYQCPYCSKAFASSGNCFSHRKRMHRLEVEQDRQRAAKIMR